MKNSNQKIVALVCSFQININKNTGTELSTATEKSFLKSMISLKAVIKAIS